MVMLKQRDKSVQTKINFYTNIFTLAVSMLVAFVYTPYLVEQLGVAAYGILPLALIINQYISVATGTLTSAYTRFYSVAIQKADYQEATKVLSTSVTAIIAIIICIVPIFIGIILNVDSVFKIPNGLTTCAQYLFLFTALSFVVSLMSSILNVTLYAQNRLDLMNFFKIIRSVMNFFIIWVLFNFINVNVAFVGVAGFIAEIIILIISVVLFYKTRPVGVELNFRCFSKSILIAILAMSVWVLIQQLGDTLLYRTDNLLFNNFLGPEASGRIGAISTLGGYIMPVTQTVGSLFGPLIIIAYSKDRHEEVKYLASMQSKVVGCLSAILCGIIAGTSGILLSLWIDPSFEEYDWWLIIKLVPLPFYAAGGILAFVYRAWNKVKIPAIATIILGIIDVCLIILFCRLSDTNQDEIILIISAIFSILQSYILNIYCVNKIYPGLWKNGMTSFCYITIVGVVSFVISKIIGEFWIVNNFGILLIQLVIDAIISLCILLFIIFNKQERKSVYSLIK